MIHATVRFLVVSKLEQVGPLRLTIGIIGDMLIEPCRDFIVVIGEATRRASILVVRSLTFNFSRFISGDWFDLFGEIDRLREDKDTVWLLIKDVL